jgi:choline kinase
MKYIITENQQLRLRNTISQLLDSEIVASSNVVCKIKVHLVDEEEEDYEKGLRFDIHVFLNEQYTRTGGWYGFVVATNKKIIKLLRDWFGLNENQYSISITAKDCK